MAGSDRGKDILRASRSFLSIASTVIPLVAAAYLVKYYFVDSKESDNQDAAASGPRVRAIKKLLQSSCPHLPPDRLDTMQLSKHECDLVSFVVSPEEVGVTLDDIGGLQEVKNVVRESVILPFRRPDLFAGSAEHIKGLLLYGEPGCGKTLVAKAIAKCSGATFINLEHQALKNKWYGETEKLVSALFSLATKLEPCVIFFDEIDSFLSTRRDQDHQTTSALKAGIMSAWDGLKKSRVIVCGATNRPGDIDPAVMRRLTRKIMVPLPDTEARADILRLILRDFNHQLTPTDLEAVADATEFFSGSDLRSLCATAQSRAVREFLDGAGLDGAQPDEGQDRKTLRPLSVDDIISSISEIVTNRDTARLGFFN